MQKDTEIITPTSAISGRWRKAFVATSLLVALVTAAASSTPALLTRTSLRNQMLSSAFSGFGLTTHTNGADGGWFHPVSFQGVELKDAQGRVVCTIDQLHTSRGLLSFLSEGSEIGQLTFVRPHVNLFVNDDGSFPFQLAPDPTDSTCEFAIQDGSLTIIVPWRESPIIDVAALNIDGRITREATGDRLLAIDGFQVFDHEPLSESHTTQNLALIAPVLSQSTRVTGAASLWIDPIQVPIDGASPGDVPIRGHAEFHSLNAHLKQAWVRQLTQLTGQLTDVDLPDRLEIVRESTVDFSVSRNGIFHQSMTFVLPQISNGLIVESSGTIRLDESLDLRLAIQLPAAIGVPQATGSPASPAAAFLGEFLRQPIRLSVRGTVSDPKLGAPEGSDLLKELAMRFNVSTDDMDQPPPVTQAVFEIIRGVSNANKDEAQRDIPGGVFNLIRAIKAEKERTKRDRPERP